MPTKPTKKSAIIAAINVLGTAAQDRPNVKGIAHTIHLATTKEKKTLAITQTLMVYGMKAADAEFVKGLLETEGHALAHLPDVPDLPILIMGLRDCGLRATPMPF